MADFGQDAAICCAGLKCSRQFHCHHLVFLGMVHGPENQLNSQMPNHGREIRQIDAGLCRARRHVWRKSYNRIRRNLAALGDGTLSLISTYKAFQRFGTQFLIFPGRCRILSQEIRLAAAERGFLSVGRLCHSREKTATSDLAQALLPVPARSTPCMPSRARPIQRRYRPGPRHGFAVLPADPCADQECGFPSPPAPIRSMMCASEGIAAPHGRHPGRRTSRRHPLAHRRPECCYRQQPAKTKGNPSYAAAPPSGRAQTLCR